MNDDRITIFDLNFIDGVDREGTRGQYLIHWFWIDERGRERHEAGQAGDSNVPGMSEIAEAFGPETALKLRTLKPGQSVTWEGRYHGSIKQVLVNRIW